MIKPDMIVADPGERRIAYILKKQCDNLCGKYNECAKEDSPNKDIVENKLKCDKYNYPIGPGIS